MESITEGMLTQLADDYARCWDVLDRSSPGFDAYPLEAQATRRD